MAEQVTGQRDWYLYLWWREKNQSWKNDDFTLERNKSGLAQEGVRAELLRKGVID